MAGWLDEGREKQKKLKEHALALAAEVEDDGYNDGGRRTGLMDQEMGEAKTLASLSQRVKKLSGNSEPEVAAPAAPVVAAAESEADDGKIVGLDKKNFWEAVLGLAPVLVGATIGGNDGGAIGGKVGTDTLTRMKTEEKESAAVARELAKEKAKDVFEREKLDVEKGKIASNLALRREQMATTRAALDAKKDASRGVNNLTHTRYAQLDFEKAKAKNEEMLGKISAAKSIIASGTADDLEKVQLQLGAIFNEGRPTDKDVEPFKGSKALLDKLGRAYSAGVVNRSTRLDRKSLMRTLEILESTNKNRIQDLLGRHTDFVAKRFKIDPEEARSYLSPETMGKTQTAQEISTMHEQNAEEVLRLLQQRDFGEIE